MEVAHAQVTRDLARRDGYFSNAVPFRVLLLYDGTMGLSPKALALALGAFWGAGIAFMAMIAMVFDYGTVLVELLGTVYKGLSPSVPGMIAGFLWGFVDGAVGGYVLALLYNYFLAKEQHIRR